MKLTRKLWSGWTVIIKPVLNYLRPLLEVTGAVFVGVGVFKPNGDHEAIGL